MIYQEKSQQYTNIDSREESFSHIAKHNEGYSAACQFDPIVVKDLA